MGAGFWISRFKFKVKFRKDAKGSLLFAGIMPITCAICGAKFHELGGAACGRCKRILCRRHFLRGLLSRQRGVCSECLKSNPSSNDTTKESSK